MDYNGWFGAQEDIALFRWWEPETGRRNFDSLEKFTADTGHECNGIMIDFGIFERAPMPEEGITYSLEDYDLWLREGAVAVDAGLRLPSINDDHAGKAPDLGAFERDRPLPHYGPREY